MTNEPHGSAEPARALVQRVTIVNRRGLHARAAARFVETAHKFDAEVHVRKGITEVSGRSVMDLMMLAASTGVEIEIKAQGREAEQAMAALVRLVEERFHED
ncbi:MAG: HPr family phosphocarrier protein [Alphaproteobacteria bacterium]